ncbi:MAG: ABC transporter ATP-binding protein [Halobaculum sp.]
MSRANGTGDPLVEVEELEKHFPITEGVLSKEVGRVRAVDGISFEIRRGETLGLVGESGCGKSTAARSLLRLDEPTGGDVTFDGEDLLSKDRAELKRFRRNAQMVFQDPESTFDPRMSVGESIAEPLRIHGVQDADKRRAVAMNLLERVGLERDDVDRYPHEFSGGQKQRIALARALVVNPEFIVADEPVSALDVSIQSKVIQLINDIKEEFGLSLLFISHDLGVIREVCDRVAVMYLGEIVEKAPTEELFRNPQHPYTKALLSAIPQPDPRKREERVQLSGSVPSPSDPPSGCRFHTRCPAVIQPEGYEMDQSNWRSLMDLRVRLGGEGIDADSVREFVGTEREIDPASVSDEQIRAEVRKEFDVPEAGTLPDDVESVVAESLDYVAAGDEASARELLSEEFTTVCERDTPQTHTVGENHEAACHLHEVEATTEEAAVLGDD